jgi:hypothetical protein
MVEQCPHKNKFVYEDESFYCNDCEHYIDPNVSRSKEVIVLDTIVRFKIKIPDNSVDTWPATLEKWLKENIPVALYRIINNRLEEDVCELFSDDFENPEPDSLSDLGDIKFEIMKGN